MNTGQQQVNTKHQIITVPLKLTANYIGWPLAVPLKYLDVLRNDQANIMAVERRWFIIECQHKNLVIVIKQQI